MVTFSKDKDLISPQVERVGGVHGETLTLNGGALHATIEKIEVPRRRLELFWKFRIGMVCRIGDSRVGMSPSDLSARLSNSRQARHGVSEKEHHVDSREYRDPGLDDDDDDRERPRRVLDTSKSLSLSTLSL